MSDRFRLATIFFASGFAYDDLGAVAEQAEISRDELVRMLLGQPVQRANAEKVLSVINERGQRRRMRLQW